MHICFAFFCHFLYTHVILYTEPMFEVHCPSIASFCRRFLFFFFPFEHTEPNRKTFRIHPITIQSFCIRLSIQNLSKRNLQCQFNFKNSWNILSIAAKSVRAGRRPAPTTPPRRPPSTPTSTCLRGHDPAQTQPSRPCRHGQLATSRWTEHDL